MQFIQAYYQKQVFDLPQSTCKRPNNEKVWGGSGVCVWCVGWLNQIKRPHGVYVWIKKVLRLSYFETIFLIVLRE